MRNDAKIGMALREAECPPCLYELQHFENFPGTDESTELEWEQSTQNFVISSVMMERGAMR